MIGIFTGAATAPSASTTTTGRDSAEGFGATLLEEITGAVVGTTADADTLTPGVGGTTPLASPPTAAELLAALSTGFSGTIAAGTVASESAEAVTAAVSADAGDTDDAADATADPTVVLSDVEPAADQAPVAPLITAPAVATPSPTLSVPLAGDAAGQVAALGLDAAAGTPDGVTPNTVTAAIASTASAATAVATVPRPAATPASATTSEAAADAAQPTVSAGLGVVQPAAQPVAQPAAPRATATAAVSAAVETEPVGSAATAEPAVASEPVAARRDGVAPVTLMPGVQTASGAPIVSPAAAASPAAPVALPVPLATQVATPIFTLAAAGPGEHVMTIDITPENLGPITVRAHVGADGVRVELFAPSDGARDALRAILPDIRKDMGGAGLGSNLDLSSQNQPADRGSEGDRQRRQPHGEPLIIDPAVSAAAPWKLSDPSTTIDVMA